VARIPRLLAALPLLGGLGCAYTIVKPLEPGDTGTRGYRFYGAMPYLLEGCTKLEVVYLPDFSRPYAVQPRAWLSKNQLELQLAAGQLVQARGEIDSTALLRFLETVGAEAIEQAGSFAALSTRDETGEDNRRHATLYRFDVDAGGVVTGVTPMRLGRCPGSGGAAGKTGERGTPATGGKPAPRD
jgi:hypothetical protein